MDLITLRTRGDPLADEAVAALKERPQVGENILDRVRAGAATEPALKRFIEGTHEIPSWHVRGSGVASMRAMTRHSPVSFFVLLAGSLIESFALADGAAVLVATGRLQRDSRNRVYETASLVRDVLYDLGDLAPGGQAHSTLLRVRLLHAYVRRFVMARGHDVGKLGVPINQMDMLHTLLVFSLVVARGVERMGVRLTAEEKQSWCAVWRLAGHFLGIDDDILFRDPEDERVLYERMRAHYRPDEGSRSLAFAVLDALAGEPPFFPHKEVLYALSRHLLGDELANGFGLPARAPLSLVPKTTALFWRLMPFGLGERGGRMFIEVNRARVLRSMPEADYSFRTA